MNTQRLYGIVSFLLGTDRTMEIQSTLDTLSQTLANLQQSPNHPQYQQQAVQSRDKLAAGIEKFESGATPAQKALITELGGDAFFSRSMVDSIEYEMQRNAVAPAVIASKVQEWKTKREAFLTKLEALKEAINYFKIAHEDLKQGDADIAFTIPRDLFKNHLEELGDELLEINNIIRPFSEVTTGSVEPVEVRQISTSSPIFFLHLSPETIGAIGVTITWLLDNLKKLLEIRKANAEC